jgi:hypothetical protein
MLRTGTAGFAFLMASFATAHTAWAQDWLPIDPHELQMTSEPNAPGAPAVYLYRQVDRDDANSFETAYVRIKILTEEGLKYANVEIPFNELIESVGFIHARTIQPNGPSIDFDGKVYEKPLVKAQGARLLAETFTLPNVQVGSIIEYRFRIQRSRGWIYDSHWILSEDLFTERAKFSLQSNRNFTLRWSWPRGLPEGTAPPKNEHGFIRMEAQNIPAVVEEEYMPPENEMRFRVDFIYDADAGETDPSAFWKKRSKRFYSAVQSFTDSRRVLTQAIGEIISPADAPESKLRKLYARVAQIDNLSFESRSEQEAKQRKAESIHDVGDVWQKGYGDRQQITWLFLALVRAAGFEADPVLVSTRDRYFFDRRSMNPAELNSSIVLAKLDNTEWYFDPGTPFTPFRMLPWWETGVEGLRLTKDGGIWVNTPVPGAADSRIERKASLKFDRGTLAGKLTVTYTGLEASALRLNQRDQDETARKQVLEDEVARAIPTGINVTLTNVPDWNGWDTPLVAQYDLEVPGWGTGAGRRVLLPVGLFGAAEKSPFQHAARTQPLYFDYPYQHLDDISIELPAPWVADSVPQARNVDLKAIAYRTTLDNGHQTLHFTRELKSGLLLIDAKGYDNLRNFYQTVRAADAERAVLSPDAPAARP